MPGWTRPQVLHTMFIGVSRPLGDAACGAVYLLARKPVRAMCKGAASLCIALCRSLQAHGRQCWATTEDDSAGRSGSYHWAPARGVSTLRDGGFAWSGALLAKVWVSTRKCRQNHPLRQSLYTRLNPVSAAIVKRVLCARYAGPAYCKSCSASFRNHIIRQRGGKKQQQIGCCRAKPCRVCTRILVRSCYCDAQHMMYRLTSWSTVCSEFFPVKPGRKRP